MKKRILTIFLVFVMVFATSLTCFASSYGAPSLDSSQYDSYIIAKYDNKARCIVYNSSSWKVSVKSYLSDGRRYYELDWTALNDTPHVRYYSDSYSASNTNGGWGTMQQLSSSNASWILEMSYTTSLNWDKVAPCIYDSNKTLYSTDGTTVFQALGLEEVTMMSLEEMSANLGKTALTVTLCGVGCLALLIGCHLLRKKSVLFLNR